MISKNEIYAIQLVDQTDTHFRDWLLHLGPENEQRLEEKIANVEDTQLKALLHYAMGRINFLAAQYSEAVERGEI